jgi:hypothetical protein
MTDRKKTYHFASVRFLQDADQSLIDEAVRALEAGLYRIDRTAGFSSDRPTSPVTLTRRDATAAAEIEIEPGRRTYEGSGMDAMAFALSVLRAPRLAEDVHDDAAIVMQAAGHNVQETLPSDPPILPNGRNRRKSIWVHAPLGALPASNKIGNGLFHDDPPLDQTLLVLPAIAVVEVLPSCLQDEGEETAPVRVPASIRIERMREFACAPKDDAMTMMRRMTRLRALIDQNSDRKVP